MKTFIAITSFVLAIGLSGVAHASFNDQGPMIDTTSARAARQDLSQAPIVHGFNQQSHHAVAVKPTSRSGGDSMALGMNCELNSRFGFQNSNLGVNC